MSVTLRQLRAFAAIAEHKSFTKAADALHLTQSSLSGLMKDMERHLEVKLFDRSTRQIFLSDAGERLLPHARRVLDEMRLLDKEIEHMKDYHQGKVRIAASQQLAASAMPDLIDRFRRTHPNIQLTLVDCSVEEVINRVELFEADLGIGPERALPQNVLATELFSSQFCLVMRPEHPLAVHAMLDWSELRNEALVILQGPFTQRLLKELPPQVSARLFHADYEVNFLSTALGMAQMGLGVTLALSYARAWVDQHGLKMVPLSQPTISRKFLLYTHKRRSPTPAVLAFKDFLLRHACHWSLH